MRSLYLRSRVLRVVDKNQSRRAEKVVVADQSKTRPPGFVVATWHLPRKPMREFWFLSSNHGDVAFTLGMYLI